MSHYCYHRHHHLQVRYSTGTIFPPYGYVYFVLLLYGVVARTLLFAAVAGGGVLDATFVPLTLHLACVDRSLFDAAETGFALLVVDAVEPAFVVPPFVVVAAAVTRTFRDGAVRFLVAVAFVIRTFRDAVASLVAALVRIVLVDVAFVVAVIRIARGGVLIPAVARVRVVLPPVVGGGATAVAVLVLAAVYTSSAPVVASVLVLLEAVDCIEAVFGVVVPVLVVVFG